MRRCIYDKGIFFYFVLFLYIRALKPAHSLNSPTVITSTSCQPIMFHIYNLIITCDTLSSNYLLLLYILIPPSSHFILYLHIFKSLLYNSCYQPVSFLYLYKLFLQSPCKLIISIQLIFYHLPLIFINYIPCFTHSSISYILLSH